MPARSAQRGEQVVDGGWVDRKVVVVVDGPHVGEAIGRMPAPAAIGVAHESIGGCRSPGRSMTSSVIRVASKPGTSVRSMAPESPRPDDEHGEEQQDRDRGEHDEAAQRRDHAGLLPPQDDTARRR